MQDTKTYRRGRFDRSRSKDARQESLRRRVVRELKYGDARWITIGSGVSTPIKHSYITNYGEEITR